MKGRNVGDGRDEKKKILFDGVVININRTLTDRLSIIDYVDEWGLSFRHLRQTAIMKY